jgi:hypothetical protein
MQPETLCPENESAFHIEQRRRQRGGTDEEAPRETVRKRAGIGSPAQRSPAVLLLASTLLVNLACGDSDAGRRGFWTVAEAESIKVVRGTPLRTTKCTGLGERRASAYRRFRCIGCIGPNTSAIPYRYGPGTSSYRAASTEASARRIS